MLSSTCDLACCFTLLASLVNDSLLLLLLLLFKSHSLFAAQLSCLMVAPVLFYSSMRVQLKIVVVIPLHNYKNY